MTTMTTRPAGAPQGKIVAQMVTTPETEPRLRATIASILPQVDRMVIVFNRYDEVPADILVNPAIEAITTDADTADAGRFFLPPGANDIVFLIDERIGYPADYVSRSIEQATEIGWDGAVFGYKGLIHRSGEDGQPRGWRQLPYADRLNHPRGVEMLGTGTVVARGDAIPPIGFMLNYPQDPDVGFALASLRAGRRAWALARADGWLRADDDPDAPGNAPPPEDERPEPPLPVVGGIREIIGAELDHVDVPHHRYVKAKDGRARPARNDKGA